MSVSDQDCAYNDKRVGLDHLFGETLSVKLAHGVIMGRTHTNTDLNLDPRPNTSKLSDLGQRLNK